MGRRVIQYGVGVLLVAALLALGGIGVGALANLLVALPMLLFVIVVHEAAHAVAAGKLGFRVFRVTLGYGRPLFSLTVRGVPVTLHRYPLGGMTLAATRDMHRVSWRKAAVALVGPATHLLWCNVALLLGGGPPGVQHLLWVLDPVAVFFWLNAALLLANLWPLKARQSRGMQRSDGAAFVHAFTAAGRAQEAVGYDLAEGVEALHAEDFDAAIAAFDRVKHDESARINLAVALSRSGRNDEARRIWDDMLPTCEDSSRLYLLNNIAWATVVLGDLDRLDQALAYTATAVEEAPEVAAFQGTRGAALVTAGRLTEGQAALGKARDRLSDDRQRANIACWLAVSHRLAGDETRAERWMEAGGWWASSEVLAVYEHAFDGDDGSEERLPEEPRLSGG